MVIRRDAEPDNEAASDVGHVVHGLGWPESGSGSSRRRESLGWPDEPGGVEETSEADDGA